MTRLKNDTGNLIASQLDGEQLTLAILVEMDFITGPNSLPAINEYDIDPTPPDTQIMVRVSNAGQNIYHDGNVYYGVGNLGTIDPIAEQTELTSDSITLSLNGIPSQLAQLAFEDNYLGRAVKVYLAVLDYNYNVINTPQVIFSGKMDNMSIIHANRSSTIELICTNKLAEWERLKGGRFNSEYQDKVINKLRRGNLSPNFPSNWRDRAFDFIPELIDKEINWGMTGTGGASGGVGGSSRGSGNRSGRARRQQ